MKKARTARGGAWVPTSASAEREIRRTRRMRYQRHRLKVFVVLLLLALAIGWALDTYVLQLVVIRDSGMHPTLEAGSLVVCVRQSFLDQLPGVLSEGVWRIGRQDLVLVDYAPGAQAVRRVSSRYIVKRVAAVAGDEIDLVDGVAMVHGEPVAWLGESSDRIYPLTVENGQLFLLGDNAGTSADSRSRAFGAVKESDVVGQPVAVVWPAYAMKLLPLK